MCMYIYVYTHTHTHTRMCVSVCVCVYMYGYVYTHVYICIRVHTYPYPYTYVCVCVCVYMYVYVCTHVYIHVHTINCLASRITHSRDIQVSFAEYSLFNRALLQKRAIIWSHSFSGHHLHTRITIHDSILMKGHHIYPHNETLCMPTQYHARNWGSDVMTYIFILLSYYYSWQCSHNVIYTHTMRHYTCWIEPCAKLRQWRHDLHIHPHTHTTIHDNIKTTSYIPTQWDITHAE